MAACCAGQDRRRGVWRSRRRVRARPLHQARLHLHLARLSATLLVLLGLLPIIDSWNILDDNLLAFLATKSITAAPGKI
jgi:hypothetical protein